MQFTYPVVVPRRSSMWVAVFALFLAAVPAAVAQDALTEGGESAARRPRTIAVAPFVNISDRPADTWIGPSITEAIAGDLAKREGVLVIGYEAFLSLRKTHAETVESEGRVRPLSATWLVTGGYQRLGDQLRITARIVDVESGVVRVGAKVDGAVDDLSILQDQILVALTAGTR